MRRAALRGNGGGQVLQEMTHLRYAFALSHLPARADGHRVKRAADREIYLGACQAPACRWQRGNRDVMPDGGDAELDARFHRRSRGFGLTGAPGSESGQD